jgi:hypothetical protein
MLTLAKIDALEKAAAGDLLTKEDEDLLRQCADDYRPLIRLGNGFKITKHHVVEAFELIFEDVKFMTGSRRQKAISLLKAAGARGFDKVPLEVPLIYTESDAQAAAFAVPVDDDEIREAS